ncbi:MAG: UDP-2,3-diacylglucosamine hydrolase [Limisphaerales bacterium]|jgi:UDP-2,3-diacylglucosamine hydrolase
MTLGKYVYFVSDVHLGVPSHATSLEREKKLVSFLESIRDSAEAIHIVGDLFDFWFEYRHAVPKGYVRILGTLASIADSGIPVYMYTGNHDLWMFDYFEKELGVPVFKEPQSWEYNGKQFLVGHGDGIGPGDQGYKFIKKVFTSRLCQWLFARIHPNFGIGLALFWSRKSREADAHIDESFKGEKEAQVIYAREQLAHKPLNFFVFGHRHCPTVYPLSDLSTFVNLGDWITHFTFGRFDGEKIELIGYRDTTY